MLPTTRVVVDINKWNKYKQRIGIYIIKDRILNLWPLTLHCDIDLSQRSMTYPKLFKNTRHSKITERTRNVDGGTYTPNNITTEEGWCGYFITSFSVINRYIVKYKHKCIFFKCESALSNNDIF